MNKYWLTTESKDSMITRGIGVTESSEALAIKTANETLKAYGIKKPIKHTSIRIIKSIDEIKDPHVRPNIGNPFKQGVWYPPV